MPDYLHIENGRASMFYVREEPWHGLGTKLDRPATAAEAIKAANLDWEVRKIPLHAVADGISRPVKGEYAIVPAHRWRDADCPIFGTVGPRYTPLQNGEAFAFFDAIVGQDAAIYETAGALGKGERVWILAKLPSFIEVAQDDIANKYLLLSNSHDGDSSVQVKFTPVRVVCKNTLVQALAGRGETIRVAHTRDLKLRLAQARHNLKIIDKRYATIETAFKEMVRVKMDSARLTAYFRTVFPDPADPDDERAAERVSNQRSQATFLFENGAGNKLKSVAGTLWTAYNAVTELVDYGRSKRDESKQLNHIWFGDGATVKVRAFAVAQKQIAEAQRKWWRR